ncbi:MAG: 4Fe-4S dicluster domain-containing protein, partial [Dehalococcoidia bacterium]
FELIGSRGKTGERGADLINRLGVETVKQYLTRDLQNRPDQQVVECHTKLIEDQSDKTILRIRATCGEVDSKQLRKIADIAERFGKGFVHFVVRGSPEIPCIDKQHIPDIEKELGTVGLRILDGGIDNLQTCYGGCCTESIMNTHPLLRGIERKIDELGMRDLKIKISAAGCPSSCGIAHLSDIGFHGGVEPEVNASLCDGCGLCVPICKRKAIEIKDGIAIVDNEECRYCGQCLSVCPFEAITEKRRGYAVLVGGHEGKDTRLGTVIAQFVSEETALQIAEKCLNLVRARGADVAAIIDEIGIDKVKEKLTSFSDSIAVTTNNNQE